MRTLRYPSTEKIVILGLAAMRRERRDRVRFIDIFLWIVLGAIFGAVSF